MKTLRRSKKSPPAWVPDTLEGTQAEYKPNRAIGKGAHGLALLSSVVGLKRTNTAFLPSVEKGQKVIVKLPRIDWSRSQEEITSFVARIGAELDNELHTLHNLRSIKGVARVFDSGVFIRGGRKGVFKVPFVVQEYVRGKTLTEYLKNKYAPGEIPFCGIPNENDWFQLAWALTKRLVLVHQQELVHRDIWPPNIIIRNPTKPGTRNSPEVVYIDFGAAVFRQQLSLSADTRRDVYTAPERTKDWLWPSRRFDVYALGGVFHYMATGQEPPHANRDDDKLKMSVVEALNRQNPALLKANAGVADVIARCLRHNPNNRVRDADNLLLELQLFSSFEDVRTVCRMVEAIKRNATKLPAGDDDLFRLIAATEIYMLAQRIEGMSHHVFDLSGDHEDIVSGLSRYLSVLRKGDEYLAVSIPDFWRSENMGINGRFLTMNRLLAERGVKIRRLFLVTREDLKEKSLFHRVAEAHLKMQDDLPSEKMIDSRYSILSTENRLELVRQNKHMGVWIKGRSAMTVIPVYERRDMTIRTVRMRRYRGSNPDELRQQLTKIIDEGKPLDQAFRGVGLGRPKSNGKLPGLVQADFP